MLALDTLQMGAQVKSLYQAGKGRKSGEPDMAMDRWI